MQKKARQDYDLGSWGHRPPVNPCGPGPGRSRRGPTAPEALGVLECVLVASVA